MAMDSGEPTQALRGIILPNETSPSVTVSRRQPSEPEILAPEGVTFRHETDALGRTHAKFLRNGKEVGSAVIRDFGHSIQITNFQIARGARRQGIGTAFQSYIEAQLGKRAVPDGMLSKAEYRRWMKLDPVAVQNYVKGTKSYTPRTGSDAYFAALGGPPVPGSRAAKHLSAQADLLAQKQTPTKPRKRRARSPSQGAGARVDNKRVNKRVDKRTARVGSIERTASDAREHKR
ncbi:hypothetical protein [Hyphomicrobium sp. LHD-15]|uniref:hypothetical protein n=1 Tax=Hyphomicrobium sp. LHD-15 TaxID=3072142 RepID=UPI00280F5C9C|nr:hypothetical protein [Hyphomicrobium sp. LHD-15]MDQ8698229.1 hypothetical protein [Hyphomicrobium sp. LHD-15]